MNAHKKLKEFSFYHATGKLIYKNNEGKEFTSNIDTKVQLISFVTNSFIKCKLATSNDYVYFELDGKKTDKYRNLRFNLITN